MRLFDSHTHLQLAEFDADRDAVLDRAWEAGLVGLLVLGTDVASSEAAIALAETDTRVFAAAGCHPHDAKQMDDAAMRRLADLAEDARVVAVGEIRLDFYRDYSPRDRQIEVFRRQLETAAGVSKPVAIHCRDAHETLFPLVETWSKQLGGRLQDGRPLGVMHYYSGDPDLALRYVQLGLLISIHTSVKYASAERLQAAAQRLPLDVLFVETDSPFGAPQSQRGRRNEPAHVSEVVEKIAELRGEPVERVAEATTDNALRLFGRAAKVSLQAASQAPAGA